jgi:hypothetical protein
MPGYAPPTPYGPLDGRTNYGSGLQLVDEVLSNVAKQFKPTGHVYDQVTTPVSVDFNMGRYPVFDPSTFFATGGNLEVADDAPTPIIDFNWSVDKYYCRDYRLQTRITRKENVQAADALRLEYSKTTGLLGVFANNRETRLAAQMRAQSNGGQFTNAALTPAVKWDQGTSTAPATIQSDIQAAMLLAYKTCGVRPNTLILDFEVALAIGNDYTLKDTIKYIMGPSIVSDGMTAVLPSKLFGLNVVIAEGTLANGARPGQAASLGGIWGNSARLIYRDPNPQWGLPSTAYAFRGRVLDGATQAPSLVMPSGDGGQEPGPAGDWAVVDRWWDYDPPGEHIRAWECVDERIVAPELGVEIQTPLSAF